MLLKQRRIEFRKSCPDYPLQSAILKLRVVENTLARRVALGAPFSFMTTSEKQSESRRISDTKKKGRDKVLAAYEEIVDKLVDEAKQASVTHAKLCFELLDATQRRSKEEPEDLEEESTLLEYLIDQLQLTPPPDNVSQSEQV